MSACVPPYLQVYLPADKPLLLVCMMVILNLFKPWGKTKDGPRLTDAQQMAAAEEAFYAKAEQEDAHEFFVFLIMQMNAVCGDPYNPDISKPQQYRTFPEVHAQASTLTAGWCRCGLSRRTARIA